MTQKKNDVDRRDFLKTTAAGVAASGALSLSAKAYSQVAGANDRIVSPTTVRRLARRYGGRARYELLAGHGHWLPGEPGWERIAKGSLTWLAQVLDRNPKRVSGTR